ncbi:hypothetical protein L202_05243 [Cryptococcus amylolentus CBS 6039]|uniref:Uncharacterized protein n=2 Tax=Cryptococcus amylolentus TaxID=104669 RepID=A0A1E3HJS9_9TREE|nr:hypothetical protein L202_05243 [Cryptococcus amylolentus CBS 6039]ODN76584.1 hypothetical protein L202_05243 [Cryptococcus amylolentus CBS 6039]ODO04568.1 hypothetical protein I350_05172 [Cryptococcus amylolentus CBS 6273]
MPDQIAATEPPSFMAYSNAETSASSYATHKNNFDKSMRQLDTLKFTRGEGPDERKLLQLLERQVGLVKAKQYMNAKFGSGTLQYVAGLYTMMAASIAEEISVGIKRYGYIPTAKHQLLYSVIDEGDIVINTFSRLNIRKLSPKGLNTKWKTEDVYDPLVHLVTRLTTLMVNWGVPITAPQEASSTWIPRLSSRWELDLANATKKNSSSRQDCTVQ